MPKNTSKKSKGRETPIPSLADECKQILGELKESPTFAMSLGSKELFHTNFLAFLLESDLEEFDGLRRRLRTALHFPVLDGEPTTTCAVWREKRNLDLVLVPFRAGNEPGQPRLLLSESRAHVIEAKLKSIPTASQLKGYDQDLKRGFKLEADLDGSNQSFWLGPADKTKPAAEITRALLSTSRQEVLAGWLPATWAEIASAISAYADHAQPSPMKFILRDYGACLANLMKLTSAARTLTKSLVERDSNYVEILNETRDPRFLAIRLRDLVSKIIYDELMQGELSKLGQDEAGLRTEVFYTNTNPGFGFEYSIPTGGENKLRIGVQIQDTEFRHFIAAEAPSSQLQTLATSPLLESGWLKGRTQLGPLGGKKTAKVDDELRVFGKDRFVYRFSRIGKEHRMSDVSAALKESITRAKAMAHDTAFLQRAQEVR